MSGFVPRYRSTQVSSFTTRKFPPRVDVYVLKKRKREREWEAIKQWLHFDRVIFWMTDKSHRLPLNSFRKIRFFYGATKKKKTFSVSACFLLSLGTDPTPSRETIRRHPWLSASWLKFPWTKVRHSLLHLFFLFIGIIILIWYLIRGTYFRNEKIIIFGEKTRPPRFCRHVTRLTFTKSFFVKFVGLSLSVGLTLLLEDSAVFFWHQQSYPCRVGSYPPCAPSWRPPSNALLFISTSGCSWFVFFPSLPFYSSWDLVLYVLWHFSLPYFLLLLSCYLFVSLKLSFLPTRSH